MALASFLVVFGGFQYVFASADLRGLVTHAASRGHKTKMRCGSKAGVFVLRMANDHSSPIIMNTWLDRLCYYRVSVKLFSMIL